MGLHKHPLNVAQFTELYFWPQLPVLFTFPHHGHKASSEGDFTITITKIATGKTDVDQIAMFGAATDSLIARVYLFSLKVNHYMVIACNIVFIFFGICTCHQE